MVRRIKVELKTFPWEKFYMFSTGVPGGLSRKPHFTHSIHPCQSVSFPTSSSNTQKIAVVRRSGCGNPAFLVTSGSPSRDSRSRPSESHQRTCKGRVCEGRHASAVLITSVALALKAICIPHCPLRFSLSRSFFFSCAGAILFSPETRWQKVGWDNST